jgi:hypothetical protein
MLRYTVCSVLHYTSVLVALYSVFCATLYKCSFCITYTACSVLYYTSVLVALRIQRVLCYIIQVFLLHYVYSVFCATLNKCSCCITYAACSMLHYKSVLVALYSVFCAT